LGLFGHLIILFVAAADASGRHEFPPSLSLPLSLKSPLRYGENPHQRAAFYEDKSLSEVGTGGIATAVQHHGKVYDLLLVA
jgi:AICAR transformylase/IMP cyclohydrolase PurH